MRPFCLGLSPVVCRPIFALLIVALLLVAAPAWAQTGTGQATDQTQTPRFEQEVIVTAARSESPLDRNPGTITLIHENDIVNSLAQDVPEMLRLAGVHVMDETGNRRNYSVDLRGFGATADLNTLVLVDGRRANSPDLSGTDWFQIPLVSVSRIEIIPGGAGAVMFGDSAANGVINIITKAGQIRGSHFGLVAGSYGTFTPELSTSGMAGDLSYAVSGRYDRSNGFRENADTQGGDVAGQVTFRGGPTFELAVSGALHGDNTGLPGALKDSDLANGVTLDETISPDDYADVRDGYVMATPKVMFGQSGFGLVDVSVRHHASVFFSSFAGGEFTGETGTTSVAVSPRIVLQRTTGNLSHHFVAGGDITRDKQDIANTTIFGGFPDTGAFTLEKDTKALYVRDEVTSGPISVAGGYRFDSGDYKFDPSDPPSTSFDAHAASIAVNVRAAEQATLFARVSRAFRYPVLDEVFDFFGNTIQTDITPQRSTDVEGGLRVRAGGTEASISVFRLTADDEIFFNPTGGSFGFGANENLDGTSHRRGVELAASAPIGRITFGGTYAWTKTSIEGGAYEGQTMPGVPAHHGTAQAQVSLSERLTLGLDALFVGPRRFEGDFAGTFGNHDGYAVVDTKVAYRQGRTRIFLDLKNLFNEEYSEYGVLGGFPTERAYYPSPGRNAVAGIEVEF